MNTWWDKMKPRLLKIKLLKDKDRQSCKSKKRLITYKGFLVRLAADFSQKPWRPEGSEMTCRH